MIALKICQGVLRGHTRKDKAEMQELVKNIELLINHSDATFLE